MKTFRWNGAKDKILRIERSISFDKVVRAISQGGLLDILQHPNKEKFGHQKILVVQIDQYAYLIPRVEDRKEIFLKTIIPSRKATKQYLPKRKNGQK